MNTADIKSIRAYPTLSSKILCRMRDVPWRLSKLKESIFPSELGDLCALVAPYTMLEYGRLRGLYRGVSHVVRASIEGDVVECGTAKGGSAALMGLTLKRLNSNRQLWVFDTFSGLPAPTKDDPDYEIAKDYTGTCVGTLDEVRDLLTRHEVFENAKLIQGLFQDTLPGVEIREIAFLHIDGDWYDSVKTCLECLYARVTPGGIIQIDDYGHWAGARKAVDEFLRKNAISARLRYLDYTGRQFTKPLVPDG
jgi:hypothetical protein